MFVKSVFAPLPLPLGSLNPGSMINRKNVFLSLLAVLACPLLHAALQPGDVLTAFTVQDQHEVEYTLGEDVHYVIVSFDMSSGKATNKYLEAKGAKFLDEHAAVFLSNIHGMPWIGRKFALPKMRKYPHRILLADSETLLNDYPQEEDRITVLELGPGHKIVSINFWDPKSGDSPFAE